jgi:hypothetical protein
MAAPIGNQFWKKRSKDGRDKDYTPDTLWEESCNYFQWCEDNPWKEKDWVGKDAVRVEREKPRPFTVLGLCIFLDIDHQTLLNYEKTKEYFAVVTRIKDIIYTQKFEGAAVGAYNSNIIARDLGLSDKKELSGGMTINWPEEKTYEANDKADQGS